MAMLASIINGNIKAIGLICRDSPAPNTMRATMPSIAAIITTGSSSRTSGTGCGRTASGTSSASRLPVGSGGAASRNGMVNGSMTRVSPIPSMPK